MMEKVAGGVKLATFFGFLLEEVIMRRCAKIVATIGPACQEEGMIRRLLKAGVNVARLNFSHGSHDNYTEVIVRLRRIAAELGRPVSILQDLQGPKIRTGELPADGIELTAKQSVTLSTQPGEPDTIPVDFDEIPRSVQPGGR